MGKLDSFQDTFAQLSKATADELALERDDRQQKLEDIRASLRNSIGDSVHRIELLETDLIDMTRTLKRLDLRVKEVARASASRSCQGFKANPQPYASSTAAAAAVSAIQLKRPAEADQPIITGFEDIDESPSCTDLHAPLGQL